ncbi:MAG: orotidine-5'-phosphate decarboxylase [Ignavibacteriales bacterium]
MNSKEKLLNAFSDGKHICVGLDTDIKKIPAHLISAVDPILEFNKIIIESTKEHAAAYKINLAFYEKIGSKGISSLEKTLEYLPNDIFTIGDAKRGDIGNTSQMYAESMYEHFKFDSTTLHPYMGYDSLEPFLNYSNKVNFILALTSNAGAMDFENQKLLTGKFLYQEVIEKVNEWNKNKNCGIVFGATHSDQLRESISSFNDLFVLLPGIGAQGGSLNDVVKTFSSAEKNNYLINVSRTLIYADSSENFGVAATNEIKRLNSEISKYSRA